jgi:hypothetical protein
LAAFSAGAMGDFDGVAGAGGFGEVGVDATVGEDTARFIERALAATPAVAGVGVVDQERVLYCFGHQCPWPFLCIPQEIHSI